MIKATGWHLPLCGLLIFCLAAAGCASQSHYYRVKAPAGSQTYYYTPKYSRDKKTGVISFVDVVSGTFVTLTNAQVQTITRAQLNQALLLRNER